MIANKPRILLIGAGKFGLNYLRILKEFHEASRIDFVGICVSTEKSAADLRNTHNVMTAIEYQPFLKDLDAVCVVTPPDTHYGIIQDCLPQVHVLSEKPLTLHSSQVTQLEILAEHSQKVLMPGQLFRFHSLTNKLANLVETEFFASLPKQINAVFVNSDETYSNRPAAFEFIHWFDLVNYLFPSLEVKSVSTVSANGGRIKNSSVLYESENIICQANFILGWDSSIKNRTFTIVYAEDSYLSADYNAKTIIMCKEGRESVFNVECHDALAREIETFVAVVKGEMANPVSLDSVKKSISLAEEI